MTERPSEVQGGEQRDRALEAAITSAPEEPGGYLVYADWLQLRGEPRGELIVVQRALATAPRDPTLRAREAALFAAHGDRLRGPLAHVGDARVDWHCGFVRAIELGDWLAAASPEELAALLLHASLQFLHRLAGAVGADTVLAPLAEHAPRTLRWLELSGDIDQLLALRARLGRLPPRLFGVEHLLINARTYRGVAEWLAESTPPR
ncbi:MAG TPA: TIGR02996 domain-containing protein [Kofleriaceae bacterium]|nr:TIGR02996 domain-containing protein [Kofleriaceae bacterium]